MRGGCSTGRRRGFRRDGKRRFRRETSRGYWFGCGDGVVACAAGGWDPGGDSELRGDRSRGGGDHGGAVGGVAIGGSVDSGGVVCAYGSAVGTGVPAAVGGDRGGSVGLWRSWGFFHERSVARHRGDVTGSQR